MSLTRRRFLAALAALATIPKELFTEPAKALENPIFTHQLGVYSNVRFYETTVLTEWWGQRIEQAMVRHAGKG